MQETSLVGVGIRPDEKEQQSPRFTDPATIERLLHHPFLRSTLMCNGPDANHSKVYVFESRSEQLKAGQRPSLQAPKVTMIGGGNGDVVETLPAGAPRRSK